MSETEIRYETQTDRLLREGNEARAEVTLLREAAEDVAAKITRLIADGFDSEDEFVRGRAFAYRNAAHWLREAMILSPVEPSGEAESGEPTPVGQEEAASRAFGPCGGCGATWPSLHVYSTGPGGVLCVKCGWTPRKGSPTAPAPVPSGGQADGEPLTVDKLAELLRLAARPVLSREALREALTRVVEDECPHEADEHAEGTCDVCDYAFALPDLLADAVLDVLAGGQR